MTLNTAGLRLKDATVITLASNVATITQSYHRIAAESSTTDDLDSIAVTSLSDLTVASIDYRPFVVLEADTGDTITVKHNIGNIRLNGAADFALSGDKKLLLFYDGSVWADVGAGGGGGGGGIGGSTGSTDNAVIRADGTGGSTVQSSGVTIDDSANMSGIARATLNDIRAGSSAGVAIETTGGSDILLLGAGGSPNATFYGNVSMDTTHKIINMADPTSAQDAATKAYVDAQFPVDETDGGTGLTTYTTGDLLYASGTNTLAKRAIGTTGQVLTVSGGVPTWAAAAGAIDYVKLSYTLANNTAGQSATAGAWATLNINTEDSDTAGICSLASNEFTLSAGTYLIDARTFAASTLNTRIRLYNVTDASVTLLGDNSFVAGSTGSQAFVSGRFVLASSKALRIEYRTSASITNGFGLAANFTADEVYAVVELLRVG